MSQTHTARTLAWAIVFGIVLAGDGLVVGSSTLVLVGAVLALPAVVLVRLVRRRSHRRRHVRALGTSRVRPRSIPAQASRALPDAGGLELYRWENEGGTPQTT